MIKTRKAQELDVIELTEDLPKYGVKKGERAVVITAFDDPDEAYDLEFVDESGTSSRFAYSIKPNQIRSADEAAEDAFDRGLAFHVQGNDLEAEKEFQRAIDLKPSLVDVLHNLIIDSFKGVEDWRLIIPPLRIVIRLAPNYEIARSNLATALSNSGVQQAMKGNFDGARSFFYHALAVKPSSDDPFIIRQNLAAVHTSLGIQAHHNGNLVESLVHMAEACGSVSNETTRHNLGLAYALLGNGKMKEGDFQDAITLFEAAEDTALAFPGLYNNFGVALASLGRLDEAIQRFCMALKITPQDTNVVSNLSQIERIQVAGQAVESFSIEDISANFYSLSNMQSQEYRIAI